jgi:hypothetical protein
MEEARTNGSPAIIGLMAQVSHAFSSLGGSPAELWKAYLLKFLNSFFVFFL